MPGDFEAGGSQPGADPVAVHSQFPVRSGAVPLSWLMMVRGGSEPVTQLQLETGSASRSVGGSNPRAVRAGTRHGAVWSRASALRSGSAA